MSKATDDVFAERQRQIDAEGWTKEHDDAHPQGELAMAGACYAIFAATGRRYGWPWSETWWKPKGIRRNLVRAAALIIAEIERLDR